MIISHKHKYVFVGLPLAASTAISKELCEMYDGEPILSKHSLYQDFLKVATDEEKTYKVIATVRNPLDHIVSQYEKSKENVNNIYTKEEFLVKNGGFVSEKDAYVSKKLREENKSFEWFLEKKFTFPYDNWISCTKKYCDFIIQFDNLQQSFEDALSYCNIESKRPLPVVNKTPDKKPFEGYYQSLKSQKTSMYVVGPFMKHHDIKFPDFWKFKRVPVLATLLFKLLYVFRQRIWKRNSRVEIGSSHVFSNLRK